MTYLRKTSLAILVTSMLWSCGPKLPEIKPTLITEKTPHDTDDPAIWVNKNDPGQSIVFGTDKDEVDGGVYAFDLDGKIIREKSITGLSYPNNVDLAYDFKLNDSTATDILMFTEREKNRIRLYAIPEMTPLDGDGFLVFEDEEDINNRRPMGIAIYTNPDSQRTYAFVSRKIGPTTDYLYQYEIVSDSTGVQAKLARKLGSFSGTKEIEAIAVDNELGFVYYADEMECIHKYYADPSKGSEEISCFGRDYFKRDIEGIAIARYPDGSGAIIVSNQQAHTFSVFDRETNTFIKEINLGTLETDGCDATIEALGNQFPNGLFVSMNDEKDFFFHDLKSLELEAE